MIYTGIDVAKLKLDVCFDASAIQYAKKKKKFDVFPNTKEGIDELYERLSEDVFVVFESTGPYSKLLYKSLCDKGIRCCCANPYYVSQFVRSMGRRAKTDKADAEALALYGERMQPKQTFFMNEKDVELQELVRAREVYLDAIRANKNRIDVPYVSDSVNISYAKTIDFLEQELKSMNQNIKYFMSQNQEHAQRLALMMTIPGIAFITGTSFLAYCPELGTLSDKQAGALAGVVSYSKQSGTTYMQEHIGGGRKRLRRNLYQSGQVSRRHDPEMYALYERLKSKGKASKLAITAVMRHLFIRVNSVLKRRVNYEVRGQLPPKVKKAV